MKRVGTDNPGDSHGSQQGFDFKMRPRLPLGINGGCRGWLMSGHCGPMIIKDETDLVRIGRGRLNKCLQTTVQERRISDEGNDRLAARQSKGHSSSNGSA